VAGRRWVMFACACKVTTMSSSVTAGRAAVL
jgi:hypothetical protein